MKKRSKTRKQGSGQRDNAADRLKCGVKLRARAWRSYCRVCLALCCTDCMPMGVGVPCVECNEKEEQASLDSATGAGERNG